MNVCMYLSIYVSMYVCIYVCIFVYMYVSLLAIFSSYERYMISWFIIFIIAPNHKTGSLWKIVLIRMSVVLMIE